MRRRLDGAARHAVDATTALILQSRRGNRTRLLRYLLELAGVPAELVIARSFGGREPSEVVDPELYGTALVRVPREGAEPLFVWAEDRRAPLDYLPPGVRGQEGVVVAPGNPRVRVPELAADFDRHVIDAEVEVDADGGATVAITETMHGAGAFFWRQNLENIPAAELERQLEAGYVSRIVPGSELVEFSFEGRDDPERPLVVRYRARVRSFGRRVGGRLVLPPLFEASPASTWARLPSRTSTMAVSGIHRELRLRVRGPGTAEAPRDARFEGPGGARFERTSRRDGDALVVQRSIAIPRMLVEASGYQAFAGFCRRATEAEEQPVTVRLR